MLRNLQQSLDETIGHPRRNTGYAGSNNSSALLLPGLLFSFPLILSFISLSLSLSPSLSLPPSFALSFRLSISYILSMLCLCLFFCIRSLYGLSFSPHFHALFISTVVVDNVVESENNIGVVASLYCNLITMYLCCFGGVTIVEAGVIVNGMIKTIMATIAEIVWHCCASLVRICVALSKRVP